MTLKCDLYADFSAASFEASVEATFAVAVFESIISWASERRRAASFNISDAASFDFECRGFKGKRDDEGAGRM